MSSETHWRLPGSGDYQRWTTAAFVQLKHFLSASQREGSSVYVAVSETLLHLEFMFRVTHPYTDASSRLSSPDLSRIFPQCTEDSVCVCTPEKSHFPECSKQGNALFAADDYVNANTATFCALLNKKLNTGAFRHQGAIKTIWLEWSSRPSLFTVYGFKATCAGYQSSRPTLNRKNKHFPEMSPL